jgi:hypothetical protein
MAALRSGKTSKKTAKIKNRFNILSDPGTSRDWIPARRKGKIYYLKGATTFSIKGLYVTLSINDTQH